MPQTPPSSTTTADPRVGQALGMLAAGARLGEVSRVVGADRKTVARWRDRAPGTSPRGPAVVMQAAEDVAAARAEVLTTMAAGQRKLAAGIEEAVDLLLAQVADETLDARDRRAAACEVLDRAGMVRQERVEVTHAGSVTLDVSELRAKIRAAREAAERVEVTVDPGRYPRLATRDDG